MRGQSQHDQVGVQAVHTVPARQLARGTDVLGDLVLP